MVLSWIPGLVVSWIPGIVASSIGEGFHLGSRLIDLQKFSVLRKITLPVKSVFLSVWTRLLDLQGCWTDP